MTRPLRIEFPGALYHVTSRGDRQDVIFMDDADRRAWLEILAAVCERFNFVVHSFCQMTNHYHAMVETPDGNLSQGMRLLNGLYTQHFNRRHRVAGHLYQGRYKAILVQKEAYLLELTRYVVLNPLRANLVQTLEGWAWSSHRFAMQESAPPVWLDAEWLLSQFGPSRGIAVPRYRQFVMAGVGQESPLKKVQHQLVLGDAEFVARHCEVANDMPLRNVSKAHRRAAAMTLQQYDTQFPDRTEAMARAYLSMAYSMAQVGAHFGVSARTVSRAVLAFESEH